MLEIVQLAEAIKAKSDGLDHVVSEYGSNFSQGACDGLTARCRGLELVWLVLMVLYVTHRREASAVPSAGAAAQASNLGPR